MTTAIDGQCPSCGTGNRFDARFCVACATLLVSECGKCGTDNALTARFCGRCATPLETATVAPSAPADQRPSVGERRHLTVLMSDLVDSTRIAAGLDPEDWRDVATRYERVAAEAITRFGGQVAKYLGDGVMAYFGYPRAHDDDAEQAVRAGLAIVHGVVELAEELALAGRPLLRVRVGIDAGAVVVSDAAGRVAEVFGETPNVAARVQSAADPDSVVITEAVARLVPGFFVLEDRGAPALKGVGKPIRVYRVVRPTEATGRLHATTAVRGLTPFVGREDELRILYARWERVEEGAGHVVIVSGEAGIGKSRLVRHFRDLISATPAAWIESYGDPFLQRTPFYAVAEILKRMLGWHGTESVEARAEHLERALGAAGLDASAALPLVAPLLGVPLPARQAASTAAPEDQRRRLFATLVQWIFATATSRPLALVVEDLQWVDPSTLELLRLLAEQCATTPLLVICTARPEGQLPGPLRGHHVHIMLNRLSTRQAREMVAHVATGQTLAREVVDAVAARTDGVPLFVEELTRLVVETDDHAAGSSIPATLEDSLMARLDRLGSAKELVQVGAVIGREFSYELMRALLPIPDAELQAGLAKATDAELLYVRGLPPDAGYVFKHALVQDAAYQALLRTERRRLHHEIAQVLCARFPALVAEQPAVIARHHAEAGEAALAAAALRRAGDMSVASGAFQEAEDHYARAVALLDQLPRTSEIDETTLLLQLALGQVMIATRGYASAEVRAVYARAGEIGARVDDPAHVTFTLLGVWLSNLLRSELRAAQAVANQLVAVATEAPASLQIWGHLASGMTRFHGGDLPGAWTQLERAVASYEDGFSGPVTQDPGVPALGYASRTAWHLGMPDTARARIERALDLAHRLEKPFDLAAACSYAAGVYLLLDDVERADQYATALGAIAAEHHLPFYSADALILRGRVLAERENPAVAIEMMREGVRQQIANGQRVGLGYYLGLVADACIRAGALDEALAAIDEALRAVPEERVDHPRLLHLCGVAHIALAAAGGEAAPAHRETGELRLREAVAVAREIGSRMGELGAAITLGDVLLGSGRAAEAHALVAPLCAAFTEGLTTVTLTDAKRLLDRASR